MRRLVLLTLALSLLVPSLAFAKKKKKEKARDQTDEVLLTWLESSDDGQRKDAAKVLGDHKNQEALPRIIELLQTDPELGVRATALAALEEYGRNEVALSAVQQAFVDPGQDAKIHAGALTLLLKVDPPRADEGVIWHTGRYRQNKPAWNVRLLDTLIKLNRQEARDLPLIVVMDISQPKNVRVAALDALEAFQHPGLHDAYLSLVSDPDKKIKLRCINGLSRAGLPGQRVQAALEDVVRTDKQGDVRAAALKGLKLSANPSLLPLLHSEVIAEKNLFALAHAIDLLLVLADESSYSTLLRLASPDWSMQNDAKVRVIHILVRLGNPGAIPTLTALRDATDEELVKLEAQRAIDLLSPEREEERLVIVEQYVRPADVVVVDINAAAAPAYSMSVQLDAGGNVVRTDGSALVGAGVSMRGSVGASASVSSTSSVSHTASSSTSSPYRVEAEGRVFEPYRGPQDRTLSRASATAWWMMQEGIVGAEAWRVAESILGPPSQVTDEFFQVSYVDGEVCTDLRIEVGPGGGFNASQSYSYEDMQGRVFFAECLARAEIR